MEKQYNDNFPIIKDPLIIENIETIINDTNIIIKQIIIPIRDYKLSAKSRVIHNTECGGLWNATNEEEQINFYNKLMSNYIYWMTKYEINTIFIDFDKMVTNKKYLFDKLKLNLDKKNIDYDIFANTYDEVTLNSKP